MTETFEQLLARLPQDQAILRGVEDVTKQCAVLPILTHLGWNWTNSQEVYPEFDVEGKKVDYCLRINQRKSVFLEVKRPSETLEKHEKQLLEYSFREGVDIAVLTNGLLWWFYLPLVRGNWQERKFFTIDIGQQSPEFAAKYFRKLIEKPAIETGDAIVRAKSIKESREKDKLIRKTIPDAWRQLIEGPDELLIELFADKVESICGYKPDIEQLTSYLQENFLNQINNEPQPSSRPKTIHPPTGEETSPVSPPKGQPRQRGASVTINNKTINASSVRDLYFQVLKYLCDTGLIDQVKPQIPYATSSKRFLISTEPLHQGGNEFRAPIEYNGYYMETHKSYKMALKQLEVFLETFGISIKY
ncbi:MAG: type I restriction endonuclease [Bacteroidota bacterium]